MIKLILLSAFLFISFPAVAQDAPDGYVKLPGNAYYRPGSDNDNVYIYRKYGADDIIRRQLLNPYATPRQTVRTLPKNDFANICGNVKRSSELRRCREDVMDMSKDREDLYRKYN